MEPEDQMDLLASHAMWARDYQGALELYTKYLKSEEHIDMLSLYRVHFNLAILSTMLGRDDLAHSYLEKLEDAFSKVERTRQTMKERTRVDIEDIWALMTEQPDPNNIESLLTEHFAEKEDLLAIHVSPRYARGFLRSAIRNAEISAIPRVMKEGILRYTLSSELYRVVGRAYGTQELTLENLQKIKPLKVLIENPNVHYVEYESLRVIAAIQREGRILCQYLLTHSQDSAGAQQIRAFLHALSEAFSSE